MYDNYLCDFFGQLIVFIIFYDNTFFIFYCNLFKVTLIRNYIYYIYDNQNII